MSETITIERQIKCVGREIGLRKNVYPKFIERGKITYEKAMEEIAVMEAVLETLKKIQESNR